MHTTVSIDIGLVLEGSVVLELDVGAKRQLDPGDWYVQNGTRHAWRNPYDVPCRVAIFMLGTGFGRSNLYQTLGKGFGSIAGDPGLYERGDVR